MNYNGPDSPPSIVLKAEPESSESNLNFGAVSTVFYHRQKLRHHFQAFHDQNLQLNTGSSLPSVPSPSPSVGTSGQVGEIQFHVTGNGESTILSEKSTEALQL